MPKLLVTYGTWYNVIYLFLFFGETEGQHADANFCQVERRFHNRESNRQPLPLDLGIFPPSSSSLRSSKNIEQKIKNKK